MKTIRLVLEDKNEKTGEFSSCQIRIPLSDTKINAEIIQSAIIKLEKDLQKIQWDEELKKAFKKP